MAFPRIDRPEIPTITPDGDAVVSIVENHIFCLKISGFLSESVSRLALARTRVLLEGRRVRVAVADTIGATGTQASVQGPVREFVAFTKEHGVREVFCAATSPAMRLLGSAVALATGVRIQFFPTAEAAWVSARAAAQYTSFR